MALVSLAELTPDGRGLSVPAAKAGPSSQRAGQAPRHLLRGPQPLLSFLPSTAGVPRDGLRGCGSRGCSGPHCPRLRAAVPLLACPSLHPRGTDLDSVGSGNCRWRDAAPQDRAEPQPSGPGHHAPSPLLFRGVSMRELGRLPREHSLPSPRPRQPRAPAGAFLSRDSNPGGPQRPPWVPC